MKTEQVFAKISQVVAILIKVPLCNLQKKYKNHPGFIMQFNRSWGPPNQAYNSPIQPLLASTMIATQHKNIASICIKKQMHLNFIIHHITPNWVCKSNAKLLPQLSIK
jgi:hypothetical protein